MIPAVEEFRAASSRAISAAKHRRVIAASADVLGEADVRAAVDQEQRARAAMVRALRAVPEPLVGLLVHEHLITACCAYRAWPDDLMKHRRFGIRQTVRRAAAELADHERSAA